jgi:eukaryotic-like serine/threonine-protein kinase
MITREIRSGEVFADRYRVIRRLGAGGMATVWLAEDERLGREVAIKRLRTDAPEESLARFRREARLGATLNHPNFVSVYDTVATDEGALIVMEYVPGQSLEDLEKRGPMDPEQAVSILRGAAAALDHAHTAGVVHRDIKPANILVREDGTVKVADLGIARALDATQITAEGKVIGTMPYMAPERLRGAGSGRPASDVYALAAVAYELLSGVHVDEAAPGGEHPPDRRALAAHWPEAPAPAFAAIMRGLSEDPARRQRSAGELVDELAGGLARGHEDTRPLTPTLPGRQIHPMPSRAPRISGARRSRAGAVLALTLVALAGLTAVGIALMGGDGGGGESPKKEAKAGRDAGGSRDASSAEATSTGDVAAPAPAAEDQASPASSSTDGASLNAEGFSLIQQGRAAEAVPVLRQAVDSFPEGTTDLNYAYALYNLGNALRLSGQPEEAIPILERRLQIPDQRSTVAAELARARAEAGAG